jgi:hypothetical protein
MRHPVKTTQLVLHRAVASFLFSLLLPASIFIKDFVELLKASLPALKQHKPRCEKALTIFGLFIYVHEYFSKIYVSNFMIVDGNTGCEVFKRGIQKKKNFCLRINIPKGNY